MNKEEIKLAREAYGLQDACNLSGVVHAFSEILTELQRIAYERNEGTDWVNRHFISTVIADKIAQLTGTQSVSNNAVDKAWETLHNVIFEAKYEQQCN